MVRTSQNFKRRENNPLCVNLQPYNSPEMQDHKRDKFVLTTGHSHGPGSGRHNNVALVLEVIFKFFKI